MKRIFESIIVFYRSYISPILPRSCRYYPTCSQYALQQFKFRPIAPALFASIIRILKCNQLFKGGIDYPIIKREFTVNSLRKNPRIQPDFWFVPLEKNKFYLIQAFDLSKEK